MKLPIPKNEFQRLVQLAGYDLDQSDLEKHLKDLTRLAAKVAGADISLVNLIDTYTQWSVATEGIPVMQMPREDSVCQYTILGDEPFEVKDLRGDERFKEKFYVTDDPSLRYYWGIPLKTEEGYNLGALCVMDKETKQISPEKVELLEIIADEIVNRLNIIKSVGMLQSEVKNAKEKQLRVAHDIRGPIGGIIGLAQIIKEQGDNNKLTDVLEFIKIIQNSGKSLLDLADEILSSRDGEQIKSVLNAENEYNLLILKDKLLTLYGVQAKQKQVHLKVDLNDEHAEAPFPKVKLLQILGNLISNAIKFTPPEGSVTVRLGLKEKANSKELAVTVTDTGTRMTEEQIAHIQQGTEQTTQGTAGEKGYGFGLPLVKHLIDSMGGSLKIESKLGEYSRFEVRLSI
ncbi:MAG: GAF domain-containing sensor histidine kinase [Lunatimonas sp.]|uniref:GAF domain-containing sensor histidine kinase n=1 Tax=Lunatimonas sp. TaxID=2060141 RepID=UPI00263B070D|nr:GAF domain-containing sensor histidine kinase [Lunatimonas sp.]MCC5938246.1 GAF domain-containing sensor histidine kinase [Lunatimonas sp.]